MNIDLKSLIKSFKGGTLVFDLPSGQVLTAYEDLNGSLLIDLRDHIDGDSIDGTDFRGVMVPPVYDDGVYVFHTDSGINIGNFKETYAKYKEKHEIGGYGNFSATYSGTGEYLKGIVDAIWLTDHLDHIEVRDGKIV